MSMTAAQLQAQLLQQQQAEAANIVALIEAMIDGRMAIHDVDFSALEAKVTMVNNLLDGDENTEGFQVFADLVNRVTQLETTTAAQATALAGLQSLVSTEIARLDAKIDTNKTDADADIAAANSRIDTVEAAAATEKTARLAKDTEHSGRLTANEAAISTAETAITAAETAIADEEAARIAGDAANATAIATEKARIDQINVEREQYITRPELDSSMGVSAQGFIDTLWVGRTRPAGLPNADGTVSE